MNWYLTKIIYRIICGDGNHTAQFDEQLRLICAGDEEEAFTRAVCIGRSEEEVFCNQKAEVVQWKFVNVAELYRISQLIDGAELYSRIQEVDDAEAYTHAVHQKAASIQEKTIPQLLHLI